MSIRQDISRKWERKDYLLKLHSNRDIKHAFASAKHSVQISFLYKEPFGYIAHLWVRRQDGKPTTWKELQQIKNELIGEDKMGIEVFPKAETLVDQAPMYHVWVFDRFDFGISEGGFKF